MTTIAALIDQIALSVRGRIFLVNLKSTLDDGFDPQPLRKVCHELAVGLSDAKIDASESAALATQLGSRCVNCGLWLQARIPDLHRFAGRGGMVLSRVMTFSQFYKHVVGRTAGAPPIEGWALPRMHPDRPESAPEIAPEQVPSVRHFIDSGAWKQYMESAPAVKAGMQCVWMLPRDALARREAKNRRPLADFYRDVIGLSHIPMGRHLVRLDFDFDDSTWEHRQRIACRRPHGAGNGGSRFRMAYDGPSQDNWGRTVHLGVVEARRAKASMNGVPEILMERFDVPVDSVQARYIGEVSRPAECNDRWFLGRISPIPFDDVVTSLKEVLA
jgi:hypothetical protein